MDRRTFLGSLTGLTAHLLINQAPGTPPAQDKWGELLPLRKLGNTDENVTMLGVGGWHIGRMRERDAAQAIELAMEGGIRFFDSAESYQSGGSEQYLGRHLVPKYRDEVYLMTKSQSYDGKTAQKHLEESLRRLNTDYLDLWQVHAIDSPNDVDGRIENGVLDVVLEAQASGKVRHIGFTGHRRQTAHLHMLTRTDAFQVCQMPVNAADPSYESFIHNVMPELVERQMGILAMKTLANGGFFGGSRHGQHGNNPKLVPNVLSIREALYFSWSMPISVLITGPDNAEQLQEKIDLARSFTKMDNEDQKQLIDRVADLAGRTVEFYKA